MFWISYCITFVFCSVIGVAVLLCRLAAGAVLSLLQLERLEFVLAVDEEDLLSLLCSERFDRINPRSQLRRNK